VGRTALLAAAVLYVLSVAVAAVLLPAEVPLHFGAGGSADRYGSRAEALTGFVLLGLLLLGLWLLVRRSLRRTSLAHINVPHPEYWKTPEHEPELRRRVEADLTGFYAATVLLLAAVPVSVLVAARGSGDLPGAFAALFGGYVVGSSVWCVLLVTRRFRPPSAS
jgi:hypothetical protein